MKKIITFLSLMLVVGFLTTACSNPIGDERSNANANSGENASSSTGRGPGGMRMPDFGQPDRNVDIMGVVKSITGNQVTILKIDRPDRASNGQGASSSTEQKRPATLNLGTATGGQGMRVGGVPGGGQRGAGGSANGTVDRAAMLENLKKQSTGEVVVTIPVGIKMLTADSAATVGEKTAPKMIEASLTDVKQDKMLSIWLNTDVKDQSVAEFVLVR